MLRPGSLEGERKGRRSLRLVPRTQEQRDEKIAGLFNEEVRKGRQDNESGRRDMSAEQAKSAKDEKITE